MFLEPAAADVIKVENVAVEVMLEENLLRNITKMDFSLEHQQLRGKGKFVRNFPHCVENQILITKIKF